MERLTKTISIDVEPGVTERIASELASTRRRGQAMNLLRDWVTAGKLLDEMGTGIMHYLMAMEKNKPDASQKERITILMGYLQRLDTSLLCDKTEPEVKSPAMKAPVPSQASSAKPKRKSLAVDD